MNDTIEKQWLPLSNLREAVQHTLERARKDKKQIGSSLDAKIELIGNWNNAGNASNANNEDMQELISFGSLANIFVVSQVSFVDSKDVDNRSDCIASEKTTVELFNGRTIEIEIRVVAPLGEKCPRCWKYATTVFGGNDSKPECGCEL